MKLSQRIHLTWNRFWYHYPKCIVCGHSLFDHGLYHEFPSRLGACINPCCLDKNVCESFNDPKKLEYCTRCGSPANKLYEFTTTSDYDGDEIHHKLCWNCDNDIINGGNLEDDAGDVLQSRAEEDYAYDPINNPRPY